MAACERAPHHRLEQLVVARCIGITSLLGMVQALARCGAGWRMAYALRRAEDAVYAAELAALDKDGGGARRTGQRVALFIGEQGQGLDLAAEIDRLHLQGQLLLCGPLSMVRAARSAWAAASRSLCASVLRAVGPGACLVLDSALRSDLP